MERLSRNVGEIRARYDAVVVGSGYGGGIAAARLARAGRLVCVLERGREILPGEFPANLKEARRELQIDLLGRHLNAHSALYDLRVNEDVNVFLGCGLGGTSLINANVAERPDRRVFDDSRWPTALRDDLVTLDQGYSRAEEMFRPAPYPEATYPALGKLEALRKAASACGATANCARINVNFEPDRRNEADVVQPACRSCGDCCAGCNLGAKTTVHLTYLADAANYGAEIFTEVTARRVAKDGERWLVHYRMTDSPRDIFDGPDLTISAEDVVVAAGTLGSTEILLRSRAHGLAVSPRLGKGFSGNADVIAFGFNNDTPISAIGVGEPPPPRRDPVGPCITGIVRMPGAKLDDAVVVEEGSIPSALARLLPLLGPGLNMVFGRDTDHGVADRLRELGRILATLVGGAYRGALRHTQVFLVMGHDDGNGRLDLDGDRLRITWEKVGEQPVFSRIDKLLYRFTKATGGSYLRNPIFTRTLGRNVVTVHPLGGCGMGDSARDGVVNHKGEVFAGAQGTATHRGLLVCDGSIVPMALGINPLLTISALAERAMSLLVRERGWPAGDAPDPRPPRDAGAVVPRARPVGIRFAERMRGAIELATAGDRPGETAPIQFTVTILIDDLDRFIADRNHEAAIVGTVSAPTLSERPLQVEAGRFNQFVDDPDRVETKRMDYRMRLVAADGAVYRLQGSKLIHDDPGFDIWTDTTTLDFRLFEGDGADAHLLGSGRMTIDVADFVRELRTMEVTNARGLAQRIGTLLRFGHFFAGKLFETHLSGLLPDTRYDPSAPPRARRPLRVGAPEIHHVDTADGKRLLLTRHRGGDKGPVVLVHGFGVSSEIFTIDTIETNLLEYFYEHGYDCWLLDYRASILLPYAREAWTADDVANYDFQPAVRKVCEVTGAETVQMMVHCFGATTFFMAMLAGLKGVRSAAVSQIATDVVVPWWPQRLLAHLRTPTILQALGVDRMNARASARDAWYLRVVDKLLRWLWPIQREERSRSATSRRITFLYGQLYEHDQLNQATLDALPELFGYANLRTFRHLARMARKEIVVHAKGNEPYLDRLDRLAIPMTFVHGAENACYDRESTARTVARLSQANGSALYARHVIPEFGHIDCIFGKQAVDKVYPHFLAHLDKTATIKPGSRGGGRGNG